MALSLPKTWRIGARQKLLKLTSQSQLPLIISMPFPPFSNFILKLENKTRQMIEPGILFFWSLNKILKVHIFPRLLLISLIVVISNTSLYVFMFVQENILPLMLYCIISSHWYFDWVDSTFYFQSYNDFGHRFLSKEHAIRML